MHSSRMIANEDKRLKAVLVTAEVDLVSLTVQKSIFCSVKKLNLNSY
jgi:hypothetical protein